MKILIALALLAPLSLFAQKNEVAVYGLGNFNPTTFVTQSGDVLAGETSPGAGLGASYSRNFTQHNSATVLFGEDAIDALLYVGNNQFFSWPLRRYELSICAVQQFTHKSTGVTAFVFEGPGTIVTHSSPKFSGTSASFAIVTGFGVDVPMTNRWSWQSRFVYENSNSGCYGDRECSKPEWAVTQNVWSGIAYRW